MAISANRSIWMLDCCLIWSENSDDGIGEWTEPWELDYGDFYTETEYDDSYGEYAGEKIVDYDDDFIMELLKPLFPQLKEG